MRSLVPALLLAASAVGWPGAASAQAEPFEFRDTAWAVTFRAPGLDETTRLGGPNQLFAGECADGTRVEITVTEGAAETAGAAWASAIVAGWESDGRSMSGRRDVAKAPAPTVLFTDHGLGDDLRRHGYAFHHRGLHMFLVHAVADGRDPRCDEKILASLGELELGEDRGTCLRSQETSRATGIAADDPTVLRQAAFAYVWDDPKNPLLGAHLLERVLERGDARFDRDELPVVQGIVGVGYLSARKLDRAAEWLARAEKGERDLGRPRGEAARHAYNLACAYSLDGKLDEAFDAMGRCAESGAWPAYWKHAQSDSDVDAMRDDPRWKELDPAAKER